MPDNLKKDADRIIQIRIGFNINTEEIDYIKSDFFSEEFAYKDPVDYTIKLMEMALEKYINETVGYDCPNCEEQYDTEWKFCPSCGWSSESEE